MNANVHLAGACNSQCHAKSGPIVQPPFMVKPATAFGQRKSSAEHDRCNQSSKKGKVCASGKTWKTCEKS